MPKSTKRRMVIVGSVALAVLLIVVGLIAWNILRNINKYKAKAKVTKATIEVQMIRFECNLYASEHVGKYPLTLAALDKKYIEISDDPWGKPYVYSLDETTDPKICVVRSSGPDRTLQT